MKKKFKLFALLLLMFVFAEKTSAQPGFDDDVNDVPVDAGISLLLTAALSYGVSKIGFKGKEKQ